MKKQKSVNWSVRRIHRLAERLGAVNYLEIGVFAGGTFLNVDLPFKAAVDPAFNFDTAKHESESVHFFPVTSDAFFEQLSKPRQMPKITSHEPGKPVTFDIIFLDGLHTFEQTARDFINSLKYAHEKTVWILDDTIPCDPYSAIPCEESAMAIRKAAGVGDCVWHGDVFKVVMWLHDLHPEFAYCTIMDKGNPQTVVWRAAPQKRAPIFANAEAIQYMEYYSMLRHAAYYFPVREDDFMSRVGQPLPPVVAGEQAEGEAWRTLLYWKVREAVASPWKKTLIRVVAGAIPMRGARKRLRNKWLRIG